MKSYRTFLPVVVLAVATSFTVQMSYADPPPWAPAHGKRAKQHPYTYYPDSGIYYSPESRVWFWLEGSDWRVGASLPTDFRPYASGGSVSIELSSEKPFEQHDLVVKQYGKPKKLKNPSKDR